MEKDKIMKTPCILLNKNNCQGCIFNSFISLNKELQESIGHCSQILNEDVPVLISGESGTGKSHFAKLLHYAECSKRKLLPYLVVRGGENKGENLYNELLSQYRKVNGGTLILEELNLLSSGKQSELIRFLENIESPGDKSRFIALSEIHPAKLLSTNQFRKDLLYRINIFHFHMPPLRKRKMDILPIATSILRALAEKKGVKDYALSPEVMYEFIKYYWPGNIRELLNTLIREVSFLKEGEYEISSMYESFKSYRAYNNGMSSLEKGFDEINEKPAVYNKSRTSLSEAEKEVVINVLIAEKGNINRAAKTLNIARNTLYKRIEEYDIIVEEFKK